jgi:acylphosphatase
MHPSRRCEHLTVTVGDEVNIPQAIRRRVVVEGRVQGVGYRVSCARQAAAAGLGGSVRNLPDGRVEAIFEGLPDRVEELIAWCRHGPNAARVCRVHISEEPPKGMTAFMIG